MPLVVTPWIVTNPLCEVDDPRCGETIQGRSTDQWFTGRGTPLRTAEAWPSSPTGPTRRCNPVSRFLPAPRVVLGHDLAVGEIDDRSGSRRSLGRVGQQHRLRYLTHSGTGAEPSCTACTPIVEVGRRSGRSFSASAWLKRNAPHHIPAWSVSCFGCEAISHGSRTGKRLGVGRVQQ